MGRPPRDTSEDEILRAGARWRGGLSLAAFIGGLGLGLHTPGAPVGLWFVSALASCAIATALRGRACKGSLLLAVLLLGAGWMQARVHTLAPTRIERLVAPGDAPRIVHIEGVVSSPMVEIVPPPTRLDPPRGRERAGQIKFSVQRALIGDRWVPLTGRVLLQSPDLTDEDVHAGQTLRVTGRLSTYDLDGEDPWRAAASRTRRPVGRLHVTDRSLIEPVPLETMGARVLERFRAFRGGARRRAVGALRGDGEEVSDAQAIMLALLLGRFEGEIQEIRGTFQRIGAAHLLAISGFHLAVLGSLALWGVRLSGERGRPGAALIAGLIIAYLFVLPSRIPVVRAGVMLLALFGSDALGRRHDRLALLAWVGVAVLVWRPAGVTSLSFILSFGITALLLWLTTQRHPWVFGAERLRGMLPERRRWLSSFFAVIRGSGVVCLLCWLVATPTIACQIGRVSPVGALASMLLTPVVTVDLGIGFIVAVSGAVWPGLGESLSGFAQLAGGVTLWIAHALESIPGSSAPTPRVSALWAANATLWSIALIHLARRPRGWRDARLLSSGAVVLLWLVWQLGSAGGLRPGVVARVDTLDVGDGTCMLVRTGGHAVLWDAGSLSRRTSERRVRDRLGELGVWRVRTAIITHPNLDHYNLLPALAEPLGIERVLLGDASLEHIEQRPRGSMRHAIEQLRAQGVRVERIGAGDTIWLGESALRIIGDGWAEASLAENDRSLVARLDVSTASGDRRVLLTGDIQADAMTRLTREGADVRADVLELPHHGSLSAEALQFVGRTGASVVFQSTGPSRKRDQRWNAAREGRVWMETPVLGSVWAEIREDGSVRAGASGR